MGFYRISFRVLDGFYTVTWRFVGLSKYSYSTSTGMKTDFSV